MQLAQLIFLQTDLACLNVDIYSVYENNTALKSTTVRDDDFSFSLRLSRPPSINFAVFVSHKLAMYGCDY